MSPKAIFWASLLGVTGVQLVGALAVFALPTIAPSVAAALGFGPELVGFQIGLVYATGIFSALLGGTVVDWLGPCRTSQAALGFAALGCGAGAIGSVGGMAASAVFLGIAYGLTHPPGTVVLQKIAPPRHRNLVFSVRQAGVPLGGLVASVLLPPIAVTLGWRAALIAVVVIALVLAALIEPMRPTWDAGHKPVTPAWRAPLVAPRLLLGDPHFMRFAVAATVLGAMQLAIATFAVTMLSQELGLSLVAAGTIAALIHTGGAFARVGWSVVADRTGQPLLLLVFITVLNIACAWLVGLLTPTTPSALVIALMFLFGVAALGWNGVFMAEVVRETPANRIAHVTGGIAAAFFIGVVLGAPLFAAVYWIVGSYTGTFATFGVLVLLPLAVLVQLWRRAEVAAAEASALQAAEIDDALTNRFSDR